MSSFKEMFDIEPKIKAICRLKIFLVMCCQTIDSGEQIGHFFNLLRLQELLS